MNITDTPIKGLLIVKPRVFEDDRGHFLESFNCREFSHRPDTDYNFVQDNQAYSRGGVLRGLHYQNPNAQGKLIRTTTGAIYDVAVDMRKDSSTFGEWFGIELSAGNFLQLFIPPEFAHGYLTLSPHTMVHYKTTGYYSPQDEHCIRWDDPELNIDWPSSSAPIVSPKDRAGKNFREAVTF